MLNQPPKSGVSPRPGLPFRGDAPARRPVIIANHLILHGYGHWLPNDPRGSGSDEVRESKLEDLGPIHRGRKRIQPPREELRDFLRQATPRLKFDPIWFDAAKRQAIADAFARIVAEGRYTVWACTVLPNHAHLCIRRHREDARTMWIALAAAAREALQGMAGFRPIIRSGPTVHTRFFCTRPTTCAASSNTSTTIPESTASRHNHGPS